MLLALCLFINYPIRQRLLYVSVNTRMCTHHVFFYYFMPYIVKINIPSTSFKYLFSHNPYKNIVRLA